MKNYVILSATFVVGAAAGGGITYLVVNKKLKAKYEAMLKEDIKSVKKTYAMLRKEPPYDDPATAAAAYSERVEELGYAVHDATEAAVEAAEADVDEAVDNFERTVEVAQELDEHIAEGEDANLEALAENRSAIVSNIFDEARKVHEERSQAHSPDEFDELNNRDPNAPFRIAVAEFFNYENEFAKITLTYYEEDDTLTDEKDVILPDIEKVIGPDAIHNFGADSDDPNIVYVRNEELLSDYEVVKDSGSYAKQVLGIRDFQDNTPRIKRMRDDE